MLALLGSLPGERMVNRVPTSNLDRDKMPEHGRLRSDPAGQTRALVLAIGILTYLLLIGLADRLGVDAGPDKLCSNRAAMAHAIDCSAERHR